jgi:hypothetical protein
MKTIIGFDGWTQGASHFYRLFPEFEKRGYRLILIHVGSWGHDIGRPKEELYREMIVRDISYYQGKSFAEILDAERPYCVLFLNTRAIAHRALNRYARLKKIPTCHSYHGLVSSVSNGDMYSGTNYLQHFKIVYNRIAANLFKIIPVYIKALIQTRADIHIWRGFLISVFEKLISRQLLTKNYIVDTQTSIGCVYLESERAHMIENYAIPYHRVAVVGNPDLMRFGLKATDMGYRCFTDAGSRTILYIDTALSKSGVAYSSDDDFVKHLDLTNKALTEQGYTILVKLHPAHLQGDVPQKVERSGIRLCKDEEFILNLKSATAVIVEPTSAALIPALLGLPLLLAKFGKLSVATYGDMISSYPRARNLCDIDHVTQLLHEERYHLKSKDVMSWITDNAGPMPAEDMPVRVVDAIEQLILDKSQFN